MFSELAILHENLRSAKYLGNGREDTTLFDQIVRFKGHADAATSY